MFGIMNGAYPYPKIEPPAQYNPKRKPNNVVAANVYVSY